MLGGDLMGISDVTEVECDNCDEAFKIKLIERPYPGKIIKSYFKSLSCDTKYITHVTDEWARKKQRKIKKLNEEKLKRQNKLSFHIARLKNKIAST